MVPFAFIFMWGMKANGSLLHYCINLINLSIFIFCMYIFVLNFQEEEEEDCAVLCCILLAKAIVSVQLWCFETL